MRDESAATHAHAHYLNQHVHTRRSGMRALPLLSLALALRAVHVDGASSGEVNECNAHARFGCQVRSQARAALHMSKSGGSQSPGARGACADLRRAAAKVRGETRATVVAAKVRGVFHGCGGGGTRALRAARQV